MLTSEIASTVGADTYATSSATICPSSSNWIDLQTHGAPVTYLGQEVVDPNGVLLTEFWNRSLKHVDSLDGSCCGPGLFRTHPTSSGGRPALRDGRRPVRRRDNGVWMQRRDPQVASWKQLTLYKRRGPWRLLAYDQQVYTDSWAPDWSSYTYFEPGQRGTMVIHIGRPGYNGDAPAGHAVIKVGTVKITSLTRPSSDTCIATVRTAGRKRLERRDRVPGAPNAGAGRDHDQAYDSALRRPANLGAQVAFTFVPAKHR